jgi:CRP/FNR family transcriptional regulator
MPNQNPQCFTCQWRDRSAWCVLNDEDLGRLNSSKVVRTFQPGQNIYVQGDPANGVYCVESGAVTLRKTDENGNAMVVGMAHAGEAIGYRDFFSRKEFMATAQAVEPVRLCFVNRALVDALLRRNPALGLRFLVRISEDLNHAETMMLQNSTLSVRTRVAHLLLALKDRYGEVEEDGTLVIRLPLSRQDIASMLGTRPETISRAIHILEESEVAQFSGRQVRVADLDILLDEIEPYEAFVE